MALPSIPCKEICVMTKSQLFNYFCDHTMYIEDAPKNGTHYAISLGSDLIFDDDTYDLRVKFDDAVKKLRCKLGLKAKK